MCIRSMAMTEITTRMPAIRPMTMELVGLTLAQPAVMPTRPARAPFRLMPISGFLKITQEVSMPATQPAQAARLVLTKIMAISVLPAVVEPGLKPNQPSQRMNTPTAAMGRLWPGMALTSPFLPYLPNRGPMTMAPASDAQPPMECTTVEPAKSMKPMPSSQPLP